MRRALPFLVATVALLIPATARAAPPQCQSFFGQIVAPGSSRSFDAPCGAGTYTLTPSDPPGGTATPSGTSLTYTPDVRFHGYDSFTYTATNGDGTSPPASVNVLVDTAPVCQDTSVSILTGSSLTLRGDPCADADQDEYDIFLQGRTDHGSVQFFDDGSDPIYIPDPGFVGVDTLGYFAEDSFGLDSPDATLTITVNALPAATPTPTPPPPDTTAPVATLNSVRGQKLKQVLAKGLHLTLATNEAGKATVTVTVDAATARKLHLKREVGRASADVRAGKLELTVKLTAKARKAIKKLRKVRLTVRAVVTDAAGNPATRSMTVTLKR
jgi:hypothetical protein